MTQAVLAIPDSDIAPVTEDAVVASICNDPAQKNLNKHAASKLRADLAELLFCAEARKRGYQVRWMQGNSKGYDVILERAGMRSLFVQVKHAFLREQSQGGSWYYRIKNCVNGRKYHSNEYDVLAVYMWDRNEWVFHGRRELGNRLETTYTPPNVRKSAAYKCAVGARNPNNWELIDQVAATYSQESLGLGQPMSDPMSDSACISQ